MYITWVFIERQDAFKEKKSGDIIATFAIFSSRNNFLSGLSFNLVESVTTALFCILNIPLCLQLGYFLNSW